MLLSAPLALLALLLLPGARCVGLYCPVGYGMKSRLLDMGGAPISEVFTEWTRWCPTTTYCQTLRTDDKEIMYQLIGERRDDWDTDFYRM